MSYRVQFDSFGYTDTREESLFPLIVISLNSTKIEQIIPICDLGASIQHAATKITNRDYFISWIRLFTRCLMN